MVETNTFNGTSVSQADYHMEPFVYEINVAAARLAREAAELVMKEEAEAGMPARHRLVAGAIGPTSKTLSISPSVEDPSFRNLSISQICLGN